MKLSNEDDTKNEDAKGDIETVTKSRSNASTSMKVNENDTFLMSMSPWAKSQLNLTSSEFQKMQAKAVAYDGDKFTFHMKHAPHFKRVITDRVNELQLNQECSSIPTKSGLSINILKVHSLASVMTLSCLHSFAGTSRQQPAKRTYCSLRRGRWKPRISVAYVTTTDKKAFLINCLSDSAYN